MQLIGRTRKCANRHGFPLISSGKACCHAENRAKRIKQAQETCLFVGKLLRQVALVNGRE